MFLDVFISGCNLSTVRGKCTEVLILVTCEYSWPYFRSGTLCTVRRARGRPWVDSRVPGCEREGRQPLLSRFSWRWWKESVGSGSGDIWRGSRILEGMRIAVAAAMDTLRGKKNCQLVGVNNLEADTLIFCSAYKLTERDEKWIKSREKSLHCVTESHKYGRLYAFLCLGRMLRSYLRWPCTKVQMSKYLYHTYYVPNNTSSTILQ